MSTRCYHIGIAIKRTVSHRVKPLTSSREISTEHGIVVLVAPPGDLTGSNQPTLTFLPTYMLTYLLTYLLIPSFNYFTQLLRALRPTAGYAQQ